MVHSTRNGVPPEGYVAAGVPEQPAPPSPPPAPEIPVEPAQEEHVPEEEHVPSEEPPDVAAEPERLVPRRNHHRGKH